MLPLSVRSSTLISGLAELLSSWAWRLRDLRKDPAAGVTRPSRHERVALFTPGFAPVATALTYKVRATLRRSRVRRSWRNGDRRGWRPVRPHLCRPCLRASRDPWAVKTPAASWPSFSNAMARRCALRFPTAVAAMQIGAVLSVAGGAPAQQVPSVPVWMRHLRSDSTRCGLRSIASRQSTDANLRDPSPNDWLMWRRTYDSWGYSPLNQINRDNVKNLYRGVDLGYEFHGHDRIHADRSRRRHVPLELRRDDTGPRRQERKPAVAIPPRYVRGLCSRGLLPHKARPRHRGQQTDLPDDGHAHHRT